VLVSVLVLVVLPLQSLLQPPQLLPPRLVWVVLVLLLRPMGYLRLMMLPLLPLLIMTWMRRPLRALLLAQPVAGRMQAPVSCSKRRWPQWKP
jgi:hypothetical protein